MGQPMRTSVPQSTARNATLNTGTSAPLLISRSAHRSTGSSAASKVTTRHVLTFPTKTAAVYLKNLAHRPLIRTAVKFHASLVAVSPGSSARTPLARSQGRSATPRNGELDERRMGSAWLLDFLNFKLYC